MGPIELQQTDGIDGSDKSASLPGVDMKRAAGLTAPVWTERAAILAAAPLMRAMATILDVVWRWGEMIEDGDGGAIGVVDERRSGG